MRGPWPWNARPRRGGGAEPVLRAVPGYPQNSLQRLLRVLAIAAILAELHPPTSNSCKHEAADGRDNAGEREGVPK
eukprot:11200989-Lingulodinium_polyedra.AAC.1